MAIDFPTSPAVDQTLTAGGTTWKFDGVGWNIVPPMQSTAVSDLPPANPYVGQFWWRGSNGRLYVYVDDGNSKQWVEAVGPVTGILDAPSDGSEYTRVNGIWRQSKQTFDLAGKTQQIINVPSWGPTTGRFSFTVFTVGTTSMQLCLRASGDGTNFASGAADYYWGGFYHTCQGGTGVNIGTVAWAGQSLVNLHSAVNVASIPGIGELTMQLTRRGDVSQPYFNGRLHTQSYDSANYAVSYDMLTTWTPFGSFPSLKAFQFFTSPTLTIPEGRIVAEWLA